jgi:hypothetical protein
MKRTNNVPKPTDSLVGRWFHSWKDGKIQWQGQVVGEVAPQLYRVTTYEWFLGIDTTEHLIPLQRMVDEHWTFYNTDEEMRDYYQYRYNHKQ